MGTFAAEAVDGYGAGVRLPTSGTLAVVSYRLGGSDGVSVEAAKWAWAFRSLGFDVTDCRRQPGVPTGSCRAWRSTLWSATSRRCDRRSQTPFQERTWCSSRTSARFP